MKIVIIGDGKVGHKLTIQLSEENYDVVLIDQNEGKLKEALNQLDILCITGDGADAKVQKEAGVPGADLVVACASTDELNMLSCLLAKRLGAKHTIARVRNPIYYQQIDLLKEDLRLSMAVNPELAAAFEISRSILLPDTAKVETFMKGKVEMVEFIVKERSHLGGVSLAELYRKFQIKVLVCAVRRGSEVIIPNGDFVIHDGDRLHIVASHKYIEEFFHLIGKRKEPKNILVCGGGKVGYYLAKQLLGLGMQVKIIEQDWKKCEDLCDQLPKATIICGNAADHDLLIEEGIEQADALVSLTGMDEENIIMSMYAKSRHVPKVVTKINDEGLQSMVDQLGMESVVSAKNVTANAITSYVRAMRNSMGSANVETVYKLIGGKIEALEFRIREKTRYTGIPLKDLKLKSNHLVACIVRNRRTIIPGGNDTLEVGDSVIVISMGQGLEDLQDIMR